nr:MAG TPA: hypothetical protein [Caudoviricetes sp.]
MPKNLAAWIISKNPITDHPELNSYTDWSKNAEMYYNSNNLLERTYFYDLVKTGNFLLPKVETLFEPLYQVMWIDDYAKSAVEWAYPGDCKVSIKIDYNDGTHITQSFIAGQKDNYITFTNNGAAEVTYEVCFYNKHAKVNETFLATTQFAVWSNIEPLPRWNAKTVINRLLVKAETLRKSQTPRFHLNAEQAEEFEKIEMPELHLTNSTLREALQTVGSYIHGEPRLNGTEISYDMYGGSERTAVDFSKYFSKSFQQSIDSALTSIDSTVDNLVSTIGYAKGVMVEPYSGGYKTVRTETLYARIQDDNMIIATTYPINRIIKLESGTIGGKYGGTDLTPYVFEASEYTRLSSYSSLYPTSRAYAIYYTQGEKNIKGLNFKQQDPITPAFKNYAILNILRAATGDNTLETGYTNLAFRVTYESVSSARVKQSKQYIADFNRVSEIAYNQGQNLIESSYYGEHLKGVVARLGNVDKVLTLYQRGAAVVPKTGTLYDDEYYISAVAVEYQPYFTKISCALSKDFNRYSDYVGINSTKRFYEISERQAYDSFINYRDYVVIGDAVTADTGEAKTLLQNISGVRSAFDTTPRTGVTCVIARGKARSNSGTIDNKELVTAAVTAASVKFTKRDVSGVQSIADDEAITIEGSLTYYDKDTQSRETVGRTITNKTLPYTLSRADRQQTFESFDITKVIRADGKTTSAWATETLVDLNEVILPVQALAMGNAVVFTFKYQDNYSAGDNATWKQSGSDVSGFYQNSVPYKDYYGNMEYLTLNYYQSATKPIVDENSESPDHWQNDIGIALPDTTLPAGDGSKISGVGLFLSTGDDPLWLQVGSTEVPTITYQIELVTNRRGLIIGSALAGNFKLIGQSDDVHVKNVYVLPYRINKFAMKLNPNNLNALQNCGQVEFKGGQGTTRDYLKAKTYTGTTTGQSWAIIDSITGDILLAENKEIGTNESVFGSNIWFTLVHDILKR